MISIILFICISFVNAQYFTAGPKASGFSNLNEGFDVVAEKTFDNCRFFTMTNDERPIKLYWTKNTTHVDVQLEILARTLKTEPTSFDSGWVAIGVSPPATGVNLMKDGDVIVARAPNNNGENAFVAQGTTQAFTSPVFKTPWRVAGAKSGSPVQSDMNVIFALRFTRDSSWLGKKNLLLAFKRTITPANFVPEPGMSLPGPLHDGWLAVSDVDFSMTSSCDSVPAVPPVKGPTTTTMATTVVPTPAPPAGETACDKFPRGEFKLPSTLPGDKTVAGAVLQWKHDCIAKQTEFVLRMQSEGWIGVGMVEPSKYKQGQAMSDADIFQFHITGESQRSHATGLVTPVKQGSFVGTPKIEQDANPDWILATFTRKWEAESAQQTPIENRDVNLIFASGDGAIGTQHSFASRYAVETPINFFTSVESPTAAPTSPPTTSTQGDATSKGANSGNPCDNAVEFENTIPGLSAGGKDIKIDYKVDCEANLITFDVTYEFEGDGWLAIGFNDEPRMDGADVYQAATNGDSVVNAQSGNQVAPVKDPNDGVMKSSSTSKEGNVFKMTFTRELTATAATDRTVSFEDPSYIIAARGTSNDLSAYHGGDGKAFTQQPVQLFTSDSIEIESGSQGRPLILVHGAFMILAWAVLAPIGAFFARFLKGVGHEWYLAHRAMLSIVSVLTLVAFVLAIISIKGLLFNSPHVIIGYIIILASMAQPFIGIVANRSFVPGRDGPPVWPDKVHWWIGRFLIFFGFINCLFGLFVYISPDLSTIVFPGSAVPYIIWSLIILGYTVAGQFILGTSHGDGGDKAQLWRKINYGMLIPGVIITIITIVIASLA